MAEKKCSVHLDGEKKIFVWKEIGSLKKQVARRFHLKAGENFIFTDYKEERIRQPQKMKVMHVLLLGEKRKEESKVRGEERRKRRGEENRKIREREDGRRRKVRAA
eukprot:gene11373-12558_t